MGTAFASSLLGLAGSLVVGLLELFAGHGQNRFYRELEEWLSTITRVGFTAGDIDGSPEQAVVMGMAEQMNEQLEALHEMFTQSDVSRALVDEKLGTLAESVDRLTHRIEADVQTGAVLERIAEGQERLAGALEHYAVRPEKEADAMASENRMRLRSIDVQMLRLIEELTAGRLESTGELRRDLHRLTEVIERATGGDSQAPQPGAAAARR